MTKTMLRGDYAVFVAGGLFGPGEAEPLKKQYAVINWHCSVICCIFHRSSLYACVSL